MTDETPDFEATLILIKPDGLAKSLTGNILTRLSEAKLEIAAAKCLRVPRDLAEKHYESWGVIWSTMPTTVASDATASG